MEEKSVERRGRWGRERKGRCEKGGERKGVGGRGRRIGWTIGKRGREKSGKP